MAGLRRGVFVTPRLPWVVLRIYALLGVERLGLPMVGLLLPSLGLLVTLLGIIPLWLPIGLLGI